MNALLEQVSVAIMSSMMSTRSFDNNAFPTATEEYIKQAAAVSVKAAQALVNALYQATKPKPLDHTCFARPEQCFQCGKLLSDEG